MTRTAETLVLEEPGRLEQRSFDIPSPGVGEAVLRVEACGLCGTDHEMYGGEMPAALPLVPGHEVIGIIEEAGPQYLAARGLSVGDRVAVEVFQTCGQCEPCRTGAYPLCRRHGLRDSYGNTPVSVEPGLWGGYATHLFLSHDSIVHRVPDGLDPVQATLFNPLGAGIRWGATLPRVAPGQVVVVLGPGLRGLCAATAALDAGARFVMITGAGPADHERLEFARRLGVHAAVDVTAEDAKSVLKAATGGLADAVIDVTASAPAAFVQAIDLARPGGTIVVAGTRGDRLVERFNPDRIVFKELTLIGARGVDGVAYRAALDLLARDRRFDDVPRRTAPLAAAAVAELLHDMAHGADRPLHAVIVP